jgi:transposase
MIPIHRETVARYKEADRVPVRGGSKPYVANRFESYVLQRWQAGCHSPKRIFLEIQAKGYTGSLSSLYRLLLHLGMQVDSQGQALQPRRLTARQAAWILTAPEQKLDGYQKQSRQALCNLSPDIAQASSLANEFIQMVRERKADRLADWIEQAQKSSLPKLKSFATVLTSDFPAIQPALMFDHSNGQTEGQVNRLKTIKRMMYGRAGFDLLRNRV